MTENPQDSEKSENVVVQKIVSDNEPSGQREEDSVIKNENQKQPSLDPLKITSSEYSGLIESKTVPEKNPQEKKLEELLASTDPLEEELEGEDPQDSSAATEESQHLRKEVTRISQEIEKSGETPESSDLFFKRAFAYFKLGEFHNTTKDYKKVVHLKPTIEQYQQTCDQFTKILQLDQTDGNAYFFRGFANVGMKNYDRAIYDFTKAIEYQENTSEAYNSRGNVYIRKKIQKKAINDYSEAIKQNPYYSIAFYNRGNAYSNLRDYQKSVNDYNEAIKLTPENSFAYFNRGLANKELKNYQEAISDFQKVKELRKKEQIEEESESENKNEENMNEKQDFANDRIMQMAIEENAKIRFRLTLTSFSKISDYSARDFDTLILPVFKEFGNYASSEHIKKYFELFITSSNSLTSSNKLIPYRYFYEELSRTFKSFLEEFPPETFFMGKRIKSRSSIAALRTLFSAKITEKNLLKVLSELVFRTHFKIISSFCEKYEVHRLEKIIPKRTLVKFKPESFFHFLSLRNDSSFFFGEFSFSKNLLGEGRGIQFFDKKSSFWGGMSYSKFFVGGFVEGRRDGEGQIFDHSTKHKIFEGQFKNNLKQGKGMEYVLVKDKVRGNSQNFVSFIGLFEKGLKNGRGQYMDLKSTFSFRGVWKNGQLVESSKKRFERIIMIEYEEIGPHLNADKIIGSGGYGDIYKVETELIPQLVSQGNIDEPFVAIKLFKLESFSFGSESYEFTFLKSLFSRTIEQCARIESYGSILKIVAAFLDARKRRLGYITRLCKYSVADCILMSSKNRSALPPNAPPYSSSPIITPPHPMLGGRGGFRTHPMLQKPDRSQILLSIGEKLRILNGTAKGMIELHKLNIMHRDLKWDNVLLTFNNEVKITDFDTLRENTEKWKMNATRTFTRRVGTVNFLAPEIQDGKYGLKCDVYSFGLMIYSLLYERKNPFRGLKCCGIDVSLMLDENSTESLYKHLVECNFRPPLLKSPPTKIPDFLIDLMVSCWQTEPLKRPSFEDIVQLFTSVRKIVMKKKKTQVSLPEMEKMLFDVSFECYTIIEFKLFVLDEERKKVLVEENVEKISMYFIHPRCHKIRDWLEEYFSDYGFGGRKKVKSIDDEEEVEGEVGEGVEEDLEFGIFHGVEGEISDDVELGKVISKYQKKNRLVLEVDSGCYENRVRRKRRKKGGRKNLK